MGRGAVSASVQQGSEQDGLVAAWAGATGTEGAAEAVALGAALLAQEALAARGAFVDRVGDECASPSEISGQSVEVGRRDGDLAQSIGALFAAARAIAGAGAWQWPGARGAAPIGIDLGLRSVTRTVTDGGGHGVASVVPRRRRPAAASARRVATRDGSSGIRWWPAVGCRSLCSV